MTPEQGKRHYIRSPCARVNLISGCGTSSASLAPDFPLAYAKVKFEREYARPTMKNVSIHEAALHLAQLVDTAACGEEVVIEKDGLPAVRLVRIEPAAKRPRLAGLLKGKFEISDDFDSPLPDDVIAGFDGR